MSDPYEALRRLLSDRPIAFHPSLARLLGGINEALFFQQIAYWSGKGSDPDWIYKTQVELEDETCLSRYQQEQARKQLKKLGVLSDQRRGVPAQLYYRINWDAVFRLLETDNQDREEPVRLREARNQDRGEVAPQTESNPQPLTSESTTEIFDRDSSNNSNGQNIMSREDTERIAWIVRDIAREFSDQAPAKSTATRACNLYAVSDKSLDEYLDVLQQARVRTKRYTGNIKAERLDNGTRPKMQYFFSVLEDLLGVSRQ